MTRVCDIDVCGVQPMGVYGSSTFRQGDLVTPSAHPAPSSSMCTSVSSILNLAVSTSPASITSAMSTSATSVSPFFEYPALAESLIYGRLQTGGSTTASRTGPTSTGAPSTTAGSQSSGSAPRRLDSGVPQTLVMALSILAGALIAM